MKFPAGERKKERNFGRGGVPGGPGEHPNLGPTHNNTHSTDTHTQQTHTHRGEQRETERWRKHRERHEKEERETKGGQKRGNQKRHKKETRKRRNSRAPPGRLLLAPMSELLNCLAVK